MGAFVCAVWSVLVPAVAPGLVAGGFPLMTAAAVDDLDVLGWDAPAVEQVSVPGECGVECGAVELGACVGGWGAGLGVEAVEIQDWQGFDCACESAVVGVLFPDFGMAEGAFAWLWFGELC